MEFLHSFLRSHLAGKPVIETSNVGCFLRLSAGLVDPVVNLNDGLVKFFMEFSYRKTVINPAHQILEGAAFNKNDSWASTCFNL